MRGVEGNCGRRGGSEIDGEQCTTAVTAENTCVADRVRAAVPIGERFLCRPRLARPAASIRPLQWVRVDLAAKERARSD